MEKAWYIKPEKCTIIENLLEKKEVEGNLDLKNNCFYLNKFYIDILDG